MVLLFTVNVNFKHFIQFIHLYDRDVVSVRRLQDKVYELKCSTNVAHITNRHSVEVILDLC